MRFNLLPLACVAVLCTILTLGLWPFHSPRNAVSWLEHQNGLQFRKYGTAISSRPLVPHAPLNGEMSLEIWLRPNRIWDYGTFMAFASPRNPYQFSLRQSQTDLLLQKGVDYGYHRVKLSRLYVKNVFHKGRPVLITVTSGKTNEACIYVDAVLATVARSFPLAATDFNGRLILGDSPGQSDFWSGEIFGFALFRRQLNATEVVQHYSTWQRNGQPHIMDDADTIALYLFDEHSGDVVSNRTPDGVGLFIPKTYVVMDKFFLERPWMEYGRSEGYWGAVLKNIIGFTPVGFFFLAYLATRLPTGRAVLATLALGTTISFIIELVQAFLPTRESGVTDLITNTIGTGLGTAGYLLARPLLARFTWLPYPVPIEGKESCPQVFE